MPPGMGGMGGFGGLGGMPGMPGMPGMEGMENDPTFMNLLNTFAKDLLSGDPNQSDAALDSIMNQFSSFMKDTENNDELKEALESVVQEIIKKDTLYDPMKTLKDEYPKWLEEKCSTEELETYNKQLDKINEICALYEKNNGEDSTQVFEMLSQL